MVFQIRKYQKNNRQTCICQVYWLMSYSAMMLKKFAKLNKFYWYWRNRQIMDQPTFADSLSEIEALLSSIGNYVNNTRRSFAGPEFMLESKHLLLMVYQPSICTDNRKWIYPYRKHKKIFFLHLRVLKIKSVQD